MPTPLRRVIFGRPIPTERAQHERLNKIQALAVFASDAISSTAYATQEILLALSVAGAAVLHLTMPIAMAITALLVIVTISYQQTIFAYPTGGGAYIVSRDNLGEFPAQVAGASLLTDYILTVSVSIAAGIAAVTSAFPGLLNWHGHNLTVPLCLASLGMIAVGNLRGLRESGTIFAVPTYCFVFMAYILLGVGLYEVIFHVPVTAPPAQVLRATQGLDLFLILRAFASGCAALTGVEAISNGIPAFRPPESRNASRTMISMSLILGTVFLGMTWLTRHFGIVYTESSPQTVPSMLATVIFGRGSGLYLAFQFSTMAILIMAANTSFQDFPRLAAIQAADGFLPRQLTNIGERLVFNNGIFVLTVFGGLLLILFRGDTDRLIPLYAVGVFLSFTLSQAGMVVRWRRLKSPGWRTKAIINTVGSFTTGAVCLVIAITKFAHGAWLIILIIPSMVALFFRIHRHYKGVAKQLRLEGYRPRQGWRHHVLVMAPDMHRGVIPALQYARLLSEDPKGVHVATNPAKVDRLRTRWTQWSRGVPLVVLDSPYRSLVEPILEYIDRLQEQDPGCLVTVILPEFVPAGLLAQSLHGQTGLMLKLRLFFKRGVVVIDVPYHLEHHGQVYGTDVGADDSERAARPARTHDPITTHSPGERP